jgi:uncharacterized Zn-binding protein involved in type VI secretion
MSGPSHRVGDSSSGHDACAPVPLVSGSGNVFVEGQPAGRLGDIYASHSCEDHGGHNDYVETASATVFVNGIPKARRGDAVSMGSSAVGAAATVFTGGGTIGMEQYMEQNGGSPPAPNDGSGFKDEKGQPALPPPAPPATKPKQKTVRLLCVHFKPAKKVI